MRLPKINLVETVNFISYFVYISLIALVAYSDNYLTDNYIPQISIRIGIILFSFLIPFIYRFVLNVKFPKNIFIPLLIIVVILDVIFSFISQERDDQLYRILLFLLTFPLTYLIFFTNLEYKNKLSSFITKTQIKITLITGTIISLLTPTIQLTEYSKHFELIKDSLFLSQYNQSSIEIYYITILIIYASFLRIKMFINNDYFGSIDNVLNLLFLLPIIKLISITYHSIGALILSALSLFCFYCFSFLRISLKNIWIIFLSLVPSLVLIFFEQIQTVISIILKINDAQYTSAFLVRIKLLLTIISPIRPFIGEGSCAPTFECNHAHNVFTDLTITLGVIGVIAAIIYAYTLIKSLYFILNLNRILATDKINLSNSLFSKRSFLKLYFSTFYFYILIISFSSEIPLYWATFSFLPFIFSKGFFNQISYIFDASKSKKNNSPN